MKAYQVQFTLPVDNPESNVFITRKKTVVVFEVPINLPDINIIGYSQLSAIARETEFPALLTRHNNKTRQKPVESK